jgi:beta-ureidopropionase / N-carbamoyl-L-amino-acid hydrolase
MNPIDPDIDLAQGMFDTLRAKTSVGRGVTRATYGEGENFAHFLARETAEGIGLEIETDAALNLYMTLPGQRRDLPRFVTGSHMDSVPHGGNYDGAAGVVAGLAAVSGLRKQGITPARDITVMAIRAEEAAWFNSNYVGSHAAFGRLDPAAFDVRRSDTGRSLAEHIAEAGGDVAALRRGQAHLSPAGVAAFLEVHIEQGPVLETAGLPIGLVTGIRGCLRHAHARCFGTYAHSGAAPREVRSDAVVATVELIQALNAHWQAVERAGGDLVFTVGQLNTDPAAAAPSKVAGETRFALDFRGLEEKVMREASALAEELAAEIGQRHRVRFALGEGAYSYPAILDDGLRRRLGALAGALDLPAMELASGAGHDSAVFTAFGVPSAMIFIRNAHGSHNPDEAMEMEDFAAATRLLARFLAAEDAA